MMYADVSVMDETPEHISNVPDSPASYLDEYPFASFLSPLLPSPDSQTHLHDNYEAIQGLPDISPINLYNSPSPYEPVSSSTATDDYVITSLDIVASTSNDVHGSCCSDVLSPESSSSLSSDSAEMSSRDNSVTSRLKSILISRQKLKRPQSPSFNPIQKSISMHNYSRLEEKRKFDSGCGVEDRNKEKYLPKSALRFPPCCVCSGTASGLHYGVNSCEPCKGFFTRYLRKKEEYKCAKENNCPITNRLRGNCSACRLKKCLSLGMSRKNSRLGRYSLSRRMETIMQVNELERNTTEQRLNQNSQSFGTHEGSDSYNYDLLTALNSESVNLDLHLGNDSKPNKHFSQYTVKAPSGFSHKLVKVLVAYMENIKPYGENLETDEQIMTKLLSHYDSYKLKISLFGNLTTIPKDEYFNLLKGYGIEIDKRMTFLKQSADEMIDIIERYCNFAKQIPNFKMLSNRDQKNLLKSSRYDFFMILMHSGYLHEKQVFLAHNGVAFHMEEVADKFFSRKLVINVCDMYHRLQNLNLSKEEKALLIAISLVFTDRCSLENPRLVEEIQFSLTQLLQKQLEKTCSSSSFRRFTKIIDCLTVMRDSSELFLKEYSQLCRDEMVIEEVPIMTELLFED